ncbi:MAG: hypothetical protein NWQ26_10005, partial [Paraglaciecola sp.]|nr:hypothetical protein [Paraglaciecola sp.]
MIKINTTLLGMTLVCAFAACSHVFAAEETKEKPKWDVLNPPFPLQSLRIETEQTTWSSLDITPDGKTMVFDMLGDLYEVPLSGGQAKALTQDFAWTI